MVIQSIIAPPQKDLVPILMEYAVPLDPNKFSRIREVTGESYWDGISFDGDNLSAVRCGWDRQYAGFRGRFYGVASGPLDVGINGVVGIWSDENGAYGEPFRVTREIPLRERIFADEDEERLGDRIYADRDGVVFGLNLSEQVMLLHLLSEKEKTQLRPGSFRENRGVAYSPEGQTYKRNVLEWWVHTGEMIQRRYSDKVGRVLDIERVPAGFTTSHAIIEGETPYGLTVIRYKLGPVLQTGVPTKTGTFDEFKGAIPVDSEIR